MHQRNRLNTHQVYSNSLFLGLSEVEIRAYWWVHSVCMRLASYQNPPNCIGWSYNSDRPISFVPSRSHIQLKLHMVPNSELCHVSGWIDTTTGVYPVGQYTFLPFNNGQEVMSRVAIVLSTILQISFRSDPLPSLSTTLHWLHSRMYIACRRPEHLKQTVLSANIIASARI